MADQATGVNRLQAAIACRGCGLRHDAHAAKTDEGNPMPGQFKFVDAEPHGIRILLVNAAGETLATSKTFENTVEAAAAVADLREHAASAHIIDRTTSTHSRGN